MAKADKTKTAEITTSIDEVTPASDAQSEIVDAEFVEETPSDVDLPDGTTDPDADEIPDEAAPEEPAEDITEAPSPEVAETHTRNGFFGVFVGGVVAAGLGFGLSQYIGPIGTQQNDALDAIEATLKMQSSELKSLRSTLTATSADSTTQDELAKLSQSLSALSARNETLDATVSDFDARITTMERRPMSEGASPEAIAAYERELEALKAEVTAQRQEAVSMEQNAQLTANQALARAAMTRVLSAMDSGAPYRSALLDMTRSTGVEAPGPLDARADSGVTPMLSLQDSFPEVARAALALARKGEVAESGNSITNFLKTQLGARSVTPQSGTTADAVLSRAESALRAGRLTDTLAEIDALPEDVQAVMADWIAAAQARRSAVSAADALMQTLNTQ